MDNWCARRKVPRGEILSIQQTWELGKLWYSDRLSLDWRPKTIERMEEIFEKVGLKGSFWTVRP